MQPTDIAVLGTSIRETTRRNRADGDDGRTDPETEPAPDETETEPGTETEHTRNRDGPPPIDDDEEDQQLARLREPGG